MRRIGLSAQKNRCGALIGMEMWFILAWTDPSLAATGFQEQMLQVQVESGRPLDEAVAFLMEKHRWQVTFEDPAYFPPTELRDQTHLRKDLHLYTPENPAPRRIVPIVGSLSMNYLLTDKSGESVKPEEIIQQLIDIYARGNSPFSFYLVRNGDWLHVVLQPVKMPGGNFAAPILDTRISVPGAERSLGETLYLFTEILSQAAGVDVGVTLAPRNFISRSRVGADFQAQDEPARIVLARLLGRFETKLCWRLLYNQGMKAHFLNLIPVPPLPFPVVGPEQ